MAKELGKKFNVKEDEIDIVNTVTPIESKGDAAATVYILAKKENKAVIEEDVAEVFGISTPTLRNYLRKLKCAFTGCDVRATKLAKELREILE